MTDDTQGSIEKGLAGDYALSIGDVLGEAWRAMHGYKLTLHGAFLLLLIVGIGLGILQAGVVAGGMQDSGFNLFSFLITLASYGFAGVATAGVVVLAARVSLQQDVLASDVFVFFPQFFKGLATYVLMTVLVSIGLFLLILPGIYLYVAYSYALPLALEKNLSPWEALETSRKAVTHRWFTVFGILTVIGLLNFAALFTLGIALIWLLPLAAIAHGIVYLTLFGLEPVGSEA